MFRTAQAVVWCRAARGTTTQGHPRSTPQMIGLRAYYQHKIKMASIEISGTQWQGACSSTT